MTKKSNKKVELVWEGKYNDDGVLREAPRITLPFQVIETINESHATREAEKDWLFKTYSGDEGDTFADGWKNKLIWGDNLLAMSSLLEKFAGKIDLIYIDPPFATGADFSFTAEVGDAGNKIDKEQTLIEEKAYRDTWGKGDASFISMMYDRLLLMRELLSDTGSIYVHCDYRVNAYIRLMLNEIFGEDNFRNEITWRRQIVRGMKSHAQFMPFSSDYIFIFSKSNNAVWNNIEKINYISIDEAEKKYMKDSKGYFRTSDRGSYSDESIMRLHNEGRVYVTNGGSINIDNGEVSTNKGKIAIKYYREQVGKSIKEISVVDNIWDDISGMGVVSSEYIGYPTQKPEKLLERIIKASSNEGDLVADFFCGSGTTLAVAEKHGRRYIGCDLGRWGIHTTRKRLLSITDCNPFEILNLGKYERQYWQSVTFSDSKNKTATEKTLYEYIAFILKLYKAAPISGMTHLHGKKGKAFVHIGAVDSPVTFAEISAAVKECVQCKQKELHILGWEWEMGVNNTAVTDAKNQGINLKLILIPREVMEQQAADKGDVHFFELAYLEVEAPQSEKRTVQVNLKQFVMPDTKDIPDDVRENIKDYSDFIDYWAIDWDFRNDTFMQGWVTYRTKKERALPTTSGKHTYDKPGKYRILVKVIDIFGNDTSQEITVTIK